MKKCNKCGIEKAKSEFYKDKGFKDGYKASCKECGKKRNKGMCAICNEEFHSEKKNQIYCSIKCMGVSREKQVGLSCDYCGKLYSVSECFYKGRSSHYCSNECRCKGHAVNLTGKLRTSTEEKCSWCGNKVIKKKSRSNIEVFCCKECYSKWQSENWVKDNHPSWEGGLVEIICDCCNKVFYKKKSQISNKNYCSVECMGEDRKTLYSGDNNQNWKGGITNISEYLRHNIREWKSETLKLHNYRCDISESNKNLIIHHLYNFSDILYELFNIVDLEIKDVISEYSDDELELLKAKCLELHYKYGLGVCLTEELHKEFHSIYGKKKNTVDQYVEFKNNKTAMKEAIIK